MWDVGLRHLPILDYSCDFLRPLSPCSPGGHQAGLPGGSGLKCSPSVSIFIKSTAEPKASGRALSSLFALLGVISKLLRSRGKPTETSGSGGGLVKAHTRKAGVCVFFKMLKLPFGDLIKTVYSTVLREMGWF